AISRKVKTRGESGVMMNRIIKENENSEPSVDLGCLNGFRVGELRFNDVKLQLQNLELQEFSSAA
ncbi:unnamed protein product, partial [Dovyalis caffra]